MSQKHRLLLYKYNNTRKGIISNCSKKRKSASCENKVEWLHSIIASYFEIMKLLFSILLIAVVTNVSTVMAQKRSIISDTTLARNYYEHALDLQRIGKYDSSNALLLKAAVLYEKHLLWKNKWDSENKLSYNFILSGQYEQAFEQTERTLSASATWLSKGSLSEADTYHILGILYTIKSEYNKALEYHQKALHIRSTALIMPHPDIAKSYNNLGILYNIKGEYHLALEYHLKALQVRILVLGESHPDIATSYNNLGIVYYETGKYGEALEYYHKALQLRITALGELNPNVARSYNNIGVVFEKKGEYDKAIEYYQKTLQIYGKTLEEYHPDIARSYNNIANVYDRKHDYYQALKYYQQSIVANVSTFQDTLVAHNPILTGKDKAYLDGSVFLTSLVGKARVLTKLSLFASHKNRVLAYQTLCLADTLAQQVINSFSSEQDKIPFLAQATQAYQQALTVCQQLYQLTGDKTYINQAFYFASRGKASVLSASLAESKAKAFAGISDSLLALDQQLQMKLARLEQQVAEELTKSKDTNHDKLTEYQNMLFTVHRQQDSLVHIFEQHYPKYYQLKHKPTIVTAQQLQQGLDHKTAVVEYVLADSALLILTFTRSRFTLQTLPVDSSLHRQIGAFSKSMRLQKQDIYEDVARKLYQLLWPKDLPAQIKQVVIIPDGVLATIPFEALLIADPAQRKIGTPAYLLEKYIVSYAYSASLLYENMEATKNTKAKESDQLLALAPVFSNSTTSTAVAGTRDVLLENTASLVSSFFSEDNTDTDVNDDYSIDSTTNSSRITLSKINLRARGWLLDGRYVSPLPASEKEVKGIEQLFNAKGIKSHIYIHEQAREGALKGKNISSYTYLHLATHGFVNTNNTQLSGLLLAQDSTSQEDGILYAGEIYNLQLQAELVTLSACETGLGKVAKGEGIIGLTRALLYAGARNVTVSLWKVADESTAVMMQSFYQHMLSGKSKAKALQEAKLELLEKSEYGDPYFWAPFILIGK